MQTKTNQQDIARKYHHIPDSHYNVNTQEFIAEINKFLDELTHHIGEKAQELYSSSISFIQEKLNELKPLANDEKTFTSAKGNKSKIGKELLEKYDPKHPENPSNYAGKLPKPTYLLGCVPDDKDMTDERRAYLAKLNEDRIQACEMLYPEFDRKKDVVELTADDGHKILAFIGVDKEVFAPFFDLRLQEIAKMEAIEREKEKIEPQELSREFAEVKSNYTQRLDAEKAKTTKGELVSR
jgi:hypothetical protein